MYDTIRGVFDVPESFYEITRNKDRNLLFFEDFL